MIVLPILTTWDCTEVAMANLAGLELHEVVAIGDYDAAEEILKTGKCDVNLKDVEWKFKTPLHWAAAKGFADLMRLLLDHGAKGTSRMAGGWTPAHCAAETGKVHALRALHLANVSVNKKDVYGDTPLDIAMRHGHAECIKFLEQAVIEIAARRLHGQGDEEEEEEDEEESDPGEEIGE